MVIELVEGIQLTPELVDSVRKWRAEGYRFALDDFEFKESWDPLLELASFIKVDVASYSAAEIMAQREALQKHDVLWLAERIEDEATYRTFLDMGFDLFQGYFHARPIIIYGLRLPPAAVHLVKLILQLYAAEPDINEITATVSADPEMAVSLIRVVNSPLYRSSQKNYDSKRCCCQAGAGEA
ncbi:EAL domain-containing protein [Marinobacter sp. 1-3A]|nr:EAL domain-containing protein [Marinobacter sp. 1-3A]